jgi:GNAT superfamily N-acetyltransferase
MRGAQQPRRLRRHVSSPNFAVRSARPEDAEALAHAWLDAGRYYSIIDPRRFRVPESRGLSASMADDLAGERDDDEIWLVVEDAGRVVGGLTARIDRPAPGAEHELMRDVGEPVLRVNSLVVLESDRRRGAGTALMTAAEDWARRRRATRAFLTTAIDSPIAVPFYEDGMRYERVSLGFWKLL